MSVFSDNVQKYYERHNVKGRILLFDFNSPEKDTVELKFSEGFDQSNFMPHGISVYQSPSTGELLTGTDFIYYISPIKCHGGLAFYKVGVFFIILLIYFLNFRKVHFTKK